MRERGDETPSASAMRTVAGTRADETRARSGSLGDAPSHDSYDRARSEAAVLARLFGDESTGNGASGAGDPPRLGRFVLLERLGAGAMGEVYLAEDTELGRMVALKRILDLGDGQVGARRRQRMVREARALAKIDHPNVVRIHDVQTDGDELCISMEYVKGTTLSGWLTARERSLNEILEVFVQAGRGLAAAHRVDLVHRDFKPDNALVGDDGRVRVVDFGLARADTDARDGDEEGQPASGEMFDSVERSTWESSARSAATDPKLRLRLTRTGAMMGTPAYMAPEQLFRAAVDHRSDQFSFCVALWEALYGNRPFEGKNIYELADAMMSARFAEPTRRRKVPRWLEHALARGLARDPRARFESMDALVAAIDPTARALRGRRVLLGGGALLILIGAVALARLTAPPASHASVPDRCPLAAAPMDAVWNQARAEAVRARFVQVAPEAYGAEAYDRLAAGVDLHARRWGEARRAACRATRVEGVQSERVLDLRTTCLARREHELDALLTQLESADAAMVRRASTAVEGLTSLEICADVERLEAAFAPPEDPAAAERVEAVTRQVGHAAAARLAGRYEEAAALAEEAGELLGEVRHPPTSAAVHIERARALAGLEREEAAERAFLDATAAAERGHHDRIAAEAWLELVSMIASTAEDHEQAGFYLERATAAVGRLGEPAELLARLHLAEGQVATAAGDYGVALAAYDRARVSVGDRPDLRLLAAAIDLASGRTRRRLGEYAGAADDFASAAVVYEAVYGPHHPELAEVLEHLGAALTTAGKPGEAETALARSLAIREAAFGPMHATVGDTLNALASTHYMRSDWEGAWPLYDRAAKILAEARGPTHPGASRPLANRGRVEARLGRFDAARASLGEALDIVERAHGPSHPQVADMLTGLAVAEVYAGEYAPALEHHQRALEVRRETMGDDNAKTAETGVTVADTQRRLGRHAEARATLRTWLPVLEDKLGAEHPHVGQAKTNLGFVELALGDLEGARVAFAAADEVFEHAAPEARVMVDYGYARALWDEDRARAREMLERAAAVDTPAAKPVAAKARAWLSEHPSK